MKILIAGDFCPLNRVARLIDEGRYVDIWNEVPFYTRETDYNLLNLECPVVRDNADAIVKCGPNLRCSTRTIEAIKFAGFNCVTLANNHFYDYGETGVSDTLDACQKSGIDYVGGGKNLAEASNILYKEIGGHKLAIINCCEHEFSIATDNTGGSNPLNCIQQYYQIVEAKRNADKVLVIIHGGVELFWLPSSRMIEAYRFFIDAGADAVINHHQHCYSGYEVYRGKPIFYGLGNFCFDGINSCEGWTTGYMVRLEFSNVDVVKFELIPYYQCDINVGIRLMNKDEREDFFKTVAEYNLIINNDKLREEQYWAWCNSNMERYKSALNPFYNRRTSWLFNSSIGKKLISNRRWVQTKDLLVNESHVERMRLLIDEMIK